MRPYYSFIFAFLLLCGTLSGQMNKLAFEEYTLDNGLHVILHQDKTTPIVAVSVMYHVGSKNENPERTGFAHFFEHLMFEGQFGDGLGAHWPPVSTENSFSDAKELALTPHAGHPHSEEVREIGGRAGRGACKRHKSQACAPPRTVEEL